MVQIRIEMSQNEEKYQTCIEPANSSNLDDSNGPDESTSDRLAAVAAACRATRLCCAAWLGYVDRLLGQTLARSWAWAFMTDFQAVCFYFRPNQTGLRVGLGCFSKRCHVWLCTKQSRVISCRQLLSSTERHHFGSKRCRSVQG